MLKPSVACICIIPLCVFNCFSLFNYLRCCHHSPVVLLHTYTYTHTHTHTHKHRSHTHHMRTLEPAGRAGIWSWATGWGQTGWVSELRRNEHWLVSSLSGAAIPPQRPVAHQATHNRQLLRQVRSLMELVLCYHAHVIQTISVFC